MADLSIRGLDDEVRERIRLRAARNGRSMEAEIRAILTEAVREREPSEALLKALRDRFGALGGVDLEIASRQGSARSVDLAS
jgi:plasmid stability protein